MKVGDLVRYRCTHHIYGVVLSVRSNAWVDFQCTVFWYNKDEEFAWGVDRLFYSAKELEVIQ